jgi:hypothetical protein
MDILKEVDSSLGLLCGQAKLHGETNEAPTNEPGLNVEQRRDRNMKVRDVMRMLANEGWVQVTQRGSHRQFKHPTKPG